MKAFTHFVDWSFGLLLIALCFFVAAETVSRKVFNFSFQGADELGGYVLAIGGALSFTIALLERGNGLLDVSILRTEVSHVGRDQFLGTQLRLRRRRE